VDDIGRGFSTFSPFRIAMTLSLLSRRNFLCPEPFKKISGNLGLYQRDTMPKELPGGGGHRGDFAAASSLWP